MNGVPMRFDYSKTINEQLPTFEYYKDRYCSYELEIMKLRKENQNLKKQLEEGILESLYFDMITDENIIFKNQQKEFIEYLEKEIKETETTIEMLCDTNSCRIPYLQNKNRLLKEILLNYKEIIGSETNER